MIIKELTFLQFCGHCYYYLGISTEFTKVIEKADQIYELVDRLNSSGVLIYFDPRAWKFFRQYKRMTGAK